MVWVVLGLLLVVTVWLFARSSAQLPFWYDESLTVRLSKLDGIRQLWSALTAGIEFTPPLIYLLTAAARMLPGPELLTARLPALAGYVALVAALFIFLERRIGSWYALAAVALIPLADYTVRYAIEARAYMLLLGVSAVALVFWQDAGDRPRIRTSAGLAAAMAVALMLHVWALLLPFALTVGEIVEALRTRRIRWNVLAALAAASPVLVIYPILLRASKTVVFGGPAYEPTIDKLSIAWRSAVPRPRVVLAAGLAALLIGVWIRRGSSTRRGELVPSGLRPPELAAIAVLLMSPLVPYLYASASAGAFMTRYALFAVPAVACIAGWLFCLAGQRDRRAGQAAAAIVLAGVLLYMPPKVPTTGSQSALIESLTPIVSTLDTAVPLVIVNPVDVLPFDDQAAEPLRSRAVFVADSNLALQYTRTNGIDLGYERGDPYLGLHVRRLEYRTLTTEHSRLYLAGKWQALSWLPQKLKDDGWTMKEIGGSRQAPIVEARRQP